jgi:hypothetical protein
MDPARPGDILDRLAAMLRGNPNLAARSLRWLAEQEENDRMPAEPLNIRVSQEVIDRMDALQDFVATLPNAGLQPTITRSTVHRLALLRGLDALEAERAAAEKGRSRRR